MLAKSSPPFDSDSHVFELKWDGTRCIAFVERQGVRLQNRRLVDITFRYPEFANSWDRLGARSAVLDGELVVLEEGVPRFKRLQEREHVTDPLKIISLSRRIPATYAAFDLLYLEGKPLLRKPLVERRETLKGLFPFRENVIFSESYENGKRLFTLAVRKGFEGIMAKDKESPYLAGTRSGFWLKIKKSFDLDAVVCGWMEGKGARSESIGSLILATYTGGRLRHRGQVGTGFDEHTLKLLHRRLQKIRTERRPFDDGVKAQGKIYWTKPEIVVRVGYQEVTDGGKLRVPVFKGIRDDKRPEECTMER